MSPPDDIDAMLVQQTLRSAEHLLTPAQLSTCAHTAGFDTPAILAVQRLGQASVPRVQIARFYHAVATKCGEPTLRLLFNNLGLKIAQMIKTAPDMVSLKDKYSVLPLVERVHLSVADMLAALGQRGGRAEFTWVSATECSITNVGCIVCTALQTQKPICIQGAIIWREIISWACHTSIICDEIACKAVGQPECVYRFTIVTQET